MADSIVRLTVEDSSFNSKIKAAAKAFADFGSRVTSAGVEAFQNFATGAKTAKVAFQGFNAVLKANALVFVATLAIQAGAALGEMIGDWISGANDAEEAQRRLNEELDKTAQLVKDILADSDFNARIAKAAGKSTSEILKMKYEAADAAYNTAMSALMNPNLKVGTEEYDKAKKILEEAEKRRRKIWEDIQVDNTARENQTGEYAVRGGGGGGGRRQKTPAEIEAEQRAKVAAGWEKAMLKSNSKIASFKPEDIVGPTESWTIITQELAKDFEAPLSPLQKLNEELKEMRANLEKAPDTQSYLQGLSLIAEKEKEIAKFKGETETVDVAKDSAHAWREAASAMSSVSGVLSSMEDPGIKIMGIIGEAIANIASGFAAASAGEGKSGSVWYWIAATAAGLATMVSTIATIHSATGYAEGGMVKGNSYSGDNIYGGPDAMVNAGELVLTRAMQGNLASQLQNNSLGNLNLSATISGEQIRLVLNNNGRRTGRGEYVTTNFR